MEDCHVQARQAIRDNPTAPYKTDFACEDCHMPYAGKSAVACDTYVGDVRTHIFKINADSLAEQFDGGTSNHWLTLEYTCLGCHTGETKQWAAENAIDVHGPDYVIRRSPGLVSAY